MEKLYTTIKTNYELKIFLITILEARRIKNNYCIPFM